VKYYIEERVRREADYICETGATVRETAKMFRISKSSVHKDVTERLREIDKALYRCVRRVLQENMAERHIRGGLATKAKYAKRG